MSRDVEAPEHLADGAAASPGVGALVDLVVRDVAAPAAGDEDLGAQRARAVERRCARPRALRRAPAWIAAISPAAPAPTIDDVDAISHWAWPPERQGRAAQPPRASPSSRCPVPSPPCTAG